MLSIAQQTNKSASKTNVPLSIQIELTYKCNCKCYYCYQKNYPECKELTTKQWITIFGQLKDMGALYLTLTGGEPLIRKDFLDIVENARKKGFAISIITNGSLVTPPIAEKISELGVMDVGVSFHAANARRHDKLAGLKNSYGAALAAVKMLRKNDIKVLVKHSVSSVNFGQYKKLEAFAGENGCGFECDFTVFPASAGEVSPYRLKQNQLEKFIKDFNITSLPCTMDKSTEMLHCDAGRSVLGITPVGEVRPCILLPISFGSLTRNPLTKIWDGKAAKKFRREETILLAECQDCRIAFTCSRCHALAYLESGQWRGKSPSCCARTKMLVP
ncbi:MAG: radical SAM protein [Chitinivibrionales bacterium]|nr:radical SAM protein [Chitinivibrionales bacterium]